MSRAHAPCLYAISGKFIGTQAPGCLVSLLAVCQACEWCCAAQSGSIQEQ